MTPEIPYFKLKTFYFVATESSFKRAAAKLFVTEGAISQQIKDLEARLGKRLFERTNRKVNLTPDGLNLYNLVAPFIDKVENIHDEFLQMSGTLKGSVRLVSFGAMLVNVLPKYLIEFGKEYPECEIFLFSAAGEDIESMVLSGTVDFGVGPTDDLPEGILGTELWRYKRYFIAPLNHPLAKKKRLTFKEIAGVPIVAPNRTSKSGKRFIKALEQHNPKLKVTVEAGDWEVVMKYVEMGFGVSVLPEIMMQTTDKKRVHLRALDDVEAGTGLSRYGILLKKGKYLSPAARELIKFLCPDFDFNALNERGSTSTLSNAK
jgi:DNA-binding transcriptional LysR family regulator